MARRISLKVILPIILLSGLVVLLAGNWSRALAIGLMHGETCNTQLIRDARARVGGLFGPMQAQPLVFCLGQSARDLANSRGQANFAPFAPSIVLIGENGQTIDVVAHEFAHTEIAERLGFLRRNLTLPTWLDEGLVMQIDHRKRYDLNALRSYASHPDLKVNNLDHLTSYRHFYAEGDQGRFHYSLSKCVVSRLLAQSKSKSVADYLDSIVPYFGSLADHQQEQFFRACLDPSPSASPTNKSAS